MNDVIFEKIKSEYVAGENVREMAKKYGISKTVIYDAMNEKGFSYERQKNLEELKAKRQAERLGEKHAVRLGENQAETLAEGQGEKPGEEITKRQAKGQAEKLAEYQTDDFSVEKKAMRQSENSAEIQTGDGAEKQAQGQNEGQDENPGEESAENQAESLADEQSEQTDKISESLADELSDKQTQKKADEKLSLLMEAADRLSYTIASAAGDKDQFKRYIVKCKENYQKSSADSALSSKEWNEEMICEKVDTKSLKEFTSAMSELCSIVRELYEIPGMKEKEAARINSEKLMMRSQGDEGEKNELNVSFSADAEEFCR